MTELATEGTSIRDTLLDAVKENSPAPEIERQPAVAQEHHAKDIKTRNDPANGETRFDTERKKTEQLRDSARKAVGGEIANTSASTSSKSVPDNVRNAGTEPKPSFDQYYGEIDRVLSPIRETFQKAGVKSDAEAIGKLVEWEGRFRNPATRLAAFYELADRYGVIIPNRTDREPAQERQTSPEHRTRASQEISRIESRPHFKQVSSTIGRLIAADPNRYVDPRGMADMEKAYADAVKFHGITSPGAKPLPPLPNNRRSTGVRSAIKNAVKEVGGSR